MTEIVPIPNRETSRKALVEWEFRRELFAAGFIVEKRFGAAGNPSTEFDFVIPFSACSREPDFNDHVGPRPIPVT